MASPTADGAAFRREDPPLVTGAAHYSDDLVFPGTLHAVFVRAPLAHGRIVGVDGSLAAGLPGVAGVFGAADLDLPPMPAGDAPAAMARPVLAADVVRFQGEAVAVVVAETRAQALDAAEAVEVDYEPLPVVTDPEAALAADAPRLFPDGNLARERRGPDPSRALEGAEVVVRGRFVNQRVNPAPLEPNAAVAVPDGDGLLLYAPCQAPFWVRDTVAEVLGMDPGLVRVVVPTVGGAFGARIVTYPEQVVVAALARRLGRPVRYVDSRSETMLAMTHGRAQVQEVELAATRDGRITGLRARLVGDGGAYPAEAASMPSSTRYMASGVYRIARVEVAWACAATNTSPVAAYRGAGRPEATAMVERAVDLLAATRAHSTGSWRRPATGPCGPSRPAGASAARCASSASACRCTSR
jgi:aerobic carbon-monoxide dehydrogenase large subunit